ncbi:hypothetical protein B0T16DRAFT_337401 [Cercophora newfieldiana]|uniref:Uncharacterized protein n=1 Tax=Cercophora newfieldiana TaxID=92897 RepID=A0AA40CIH6_9PEZI|nr:hypothetical protein B0T16DRAFT_337401 [Cercophora newfieldiana]
MAPFPPLGTLRIARPTDVLRIGIVDAAGFRYSPLFKWERPHHQDFPGGTLLSYHAQFLDTIKSDDSVVLIQEDAYIPNENDKTSAVIPDNKGWAAPEAGEQVVVGVLCSGGSGSYPDLPSNPGRDLNRRHYDDWGTLAVDARRRNSLEGDSIVAMLAYWKRGHGTRLATWARDLSVLDQIPQCASSATMSQLLFLSLGYCQVDSITADGDEDGPEGVSTALMEYGGTALKEAWPVT